MRYNKRDFTYKITTMPKVPAVLKFIQQEAQLDDKEAYGNLNMGAGFALFVPNDKAKAVVELAKKEGIPALVAGTVEKGKRQVVIEPLKLTFAAESLQVRV